MQQYRRLRGLSESSVFLVFIVGECSLLHGRSFLAHYYLLWSRQIGSKLIVRRTCYLDKQCYSCCSSHFNLKEIKYCEVLQQRRCLHCPIYHLSMWSLMREWPTAKCSQKMMANSSLTTPIFLSTCISFSSIEIAMFPGQLSCSMQKVNAWRKSWSRTQDSSWFIVIAEFEKICWHNSILNSWIWLEWRPT